MTLPVHRLNPRDAWPEASVASISRSIDGLGRLSLAEFRCVGVAKASFCHQRNICYVANTLFALFGAAILLGGCRTLHTGLAPSQDTALLIEAIRNDMVEWDANVIGLRPAYVNDAPTSPPMRLLQIGEPAVPGLISALDDPGRFVVAHVLLAHILRVPNSHAPPYWTGLYVNLHADGTVDYRPSQRQRLKRIWMWIWDERRHGSVTRSPNQTPTTTSWKEEP